MACSSVHSSSEGGERKLDDERGEGKSPEVVFISPEQWTRQSPAERPKQSTELEVIMNQFWADEIKLAQKRGHQRGCHEAEPTEQKAKQLEQNRKYACQHRKDESTEVRACRLAKMRTYEHQRRLVESEDDRARRLERMRQYGRQRLQNESEEQRAERLAKMRARERQRRLVESESNRAERLSKMRAYQRQRRQRTPVNPSPKCQPEQCSVQVSMEGQQNELEGEIQVKVFPREHGPPSLVEVSMEDHCKLEGGKTELLNECRQSACEKEAELEELQDDRGKRMARMRAYERQRRQQKSEEDRAKRLAKMRAREHQRRQEVSEYDRAQRLTRLRVHLCRQGNQTKQWEEMLKCEGQNAADTDGSPLEGDKQMAEHQSEQLERLLALQNQHKENDNSESVHVPISRFVGQEGNPDESEGDGTKQTERMYEDRDVLHTESSIQAHTVSEDQQDQLESFKGICYYSYCDI